jgi:DNA invertase Pin-like site-specific DNA recombinase
MKKFIAYYRVSRKSQGESGLGIAAQKATVASYVKAQGGELLDEYTEIETGTNKRERVIIHQAIQSAKKNNATLLIAKIDRLARNVSFVSSLMETGIDFIACDMPSANPFTIHIFAALAEQEAKLISSITKAALAEIKATGRTLGTPSNLNKIARQKGADKNRMIARESKSNIQAYEISNQCRAAGMTFKQTADYLNKLNYTTRFGNTFRPSTVKQLLDRMKIAAD